MSLLPEQIFMQSYTDESVEFIRKNSISVLNSSDDEANTIKVFVTDGSAGSGIILKKGISVTLAASDGNVLPNITIEPTTGVGTFEVVIQ